MMNAANEVAVAAFLGGRLPFMEISTLVAQVTADFQPPATLGLDELLEADRWARERALGLVDRPISPAPGRGGGLKAGASYSPGRPWGASS